MAIAPFPGGVDLVTAEQLARQVSHEDSEGDPLALLSKLVDASLVSVASQEAARYTQLETVRAYLLDQLNARGLRDEAEQRFLRWSRDAAVSIGAGLNSIDEPAADAHLRVELANLRAARDLASNRDEMDICVDIVFALDEASIWRDVQELWHWSMELADDPRLADHRRRVAILGSAAEGAWLLGELARSEELFVEGIELADRLGDKTERLRCYNAGAVLALFNGEFDQARDYWLLGSEISATPAAHLEGAALAASYAGDNERARSLLDRAVIEELAHPCLSHQAFRLYVEGEIAAATDPTTAESAYVAAVEVARRCRAGFIEGVATVGLAALWTRTGNIDAAARGFHLLLEYWQSSGNETQLWTTVRNVARLVIEQGDAVLGARLLEAADRSPAAAEVMGDELEFNQQAQRVLRERSDDELIRYPELSSGAQVVSAARAALARIAPAD